MFDVNLIAVIVAGVANMALGFIWYGPLFGKKWMNLMGWGKMSEKEIKKMQSEATPAHITSLVGSILGAYILAAFMNGLGAVTLNEGMMIGFWIWLGFIAPVMLGDILYSGKPKMGLFYLNAGYRLVGILVMADVLILLA